MFIAALLISKIGSNPKRQIIWWYHTIGYSKSERSITTCKIMDLKNLMCKEARHKRIHALLFYLCKVERQVAGYSPLGRK